MRWYLVCGCVRGEGLMVRQHVFCEYIEDSVFHFVQSPGFVAYIVEGAFYGFNVNYRLDLGYYVLWGTL